MICTDSQSLATALEGDGPETSDLSLTLDSLRRPIKIQWIPGHMGIQGNELADRVANEACNLTDESKPITLKSAISTIKRSFKDSPPPPTCPDGRNPCKPVYITRRESYSKPKRRYDDCALEIWPQLEVGSLSAPHEPSRRPHLPEMSRNPGNARRLVTGISRNNSSKTRNFWHN